MSKELSPIPDKKLSSLSFLIRCLVAGGMVGAVGGDFYTRYHNPELGPYEKINDLDFLLSLFGRRMEEFQDKKAEEILNFKRVLVIDHSKKFNFEVNWKRLSQLPEIGSLKGSSLVLVFTDAELPHYAGNGEVISGYKYPLGGLRTLLESSEILIVINTLPKEKISQKKRGVILSDTLGHEFGHTILDKKKSVEMQLRQREENFADEYVKKNIRILSRVIKVRKGESPETTPETKVVPDLLINALLVSFQLDSITGNSKIF